MKKNAVLETKRITTLDKSSLMSILTPWTGQDGHMTLYHRDQHGQEYNSMWLAWWANVGEKSTAIKQKSIFLKVKRGKKERKIER